MRTKKSYPYEIKGTFRPDLGYLTIDEARVALRELGLSDDQAIAEKALTMA